MTAKGKQQSQLSAHFLDINRFAFSFSYRIYILISRYLELSPTISNFPS